MERTLPIGRIVSLQVGMPRPMLSGKRVWESAIVKEPVAGKVPLGAENLAGDYQANRKYHGGPDKAICAYSAEHYPAWRELLAREMPFGAFGENITVEDLTEDRVCIGDVLAVGGSGVRLQVTQPRQPCSNISKRWEAPRLPRRMEETGFTGFYARTLALGEMGAGDIITVLERPHPDWTLLCANQVMYAHDADVAQITALRSLTRLSAEWKRILGRKLRKIEGETEKE